MHRAHIHFSGTVQGVGFRYTTLSLARRSALTGWVKNLPDGRVEAIVEGPRDAVEGLVAGLKEQFGAFIRDAQIVWLTPKGDFDGFSVI
jgi:acylphosphatase